MIDNLDVNDRHYNRKYADMSNRLDDLYDKIDEIEQSIDNIDITLEEATAQKVSAKEIYKILANFDKLYDKMNDIEKKKFFHTLLERVEVHDTREKQSDGIIKKVVFKFPVFIDGQLADTVMLTKKSTVESCVLLERVSNRKADSYVKLNVKMEDYYRIKDAEGGEADG
jgi:site-specific DNA recombinase